MFEKASRVKLRFNTSAGVLAVEDLWDLRLVELDTLARKLNKEVKELEEESFIEKPLFKNELLVLRFNIVKHIIDVKLAERDAANQAKDKAAHKEKLLAILAAKDNEALQSKSRDELLAELNALG